MPNAGAKPRPSAPSRPPIRWFVVIAWLTYACQIFVGLVGPKERRRRVAR
jgi:hypothetical protein